MRRPNILVTPRRADNKRLMGLLSFLPIPIALLDDTRRVVLANAAWQARAGGPISIGDDALEMFASDSHPQILKAQFNHQAVSVRFVRASDPVLLRRMRLPDGAGTVLLIDDGTELLRLRAAEAQSQRLQAVGQLAAGIAHDFNNLLTAILGAADMIAERSDDARTRADAAIIRSSGERGADMVRQLLALGGQQTLLPQLIGVNAAMTSLAEMLRRLLPSSIALDVMLETPGRAVRVDGNQLDRALVNLVVNGRDAMTSGGRISLATGHATLLELHHAWPNPVPPDRYVTISVHDDGPGMDMALQARIFEPFFTTKRDAGGTGLGLATVLGIVRQSEGFLTLRSAPNEGTSVTLYFPRHGLPAPVVAPTIAVAKADDQPEERCVLLVDDEDMLRDLATAVLTRRGWRVLAADCAEAALVMLDDGPISAIVTDMMMPGMDGGTLVHTVRARLDQLELPAILVSGYADAGLRRHAADTATLFLGKPYKMSELADHLERLTRSGA